MYSNRDHSFTRTNFITEQFQHNIRDLKSKSRSTSKLEPRLYELGQIKRYNDINSPILTQQRRAVIEQKLDLERKAKVLTKKRIKENDSFVRYKNNPFMNFSHTNLKKYLVSDRSRSNTPKHNTDHQSNRNIIEAVNDIKRNDFKVNTMKFDRQCLETSKLASKIKEKTLKNAQSSELNHEKKVSSLKTKSLSFDDIVHMQDESFFTSQQREINIFKIVRGCRSEMITNDILVKYHFNFVSMVDKIENLAIPIYRDLSKLGRSLVLTKLKIQKSARLDVLRSADLTFELRDIRFGDIINVSSGRINPELCYTILYEGNADHELTPSSTLIEDEYIAYDDIKYQTMMKFENFNDDAQQIIDYKRLENTHKQNLNEMQCQKYYQTVDEILAKKGKISSVTIKDRQLHRKLDDQVNMNIENLLKLNKNDLIPNDRLIRYNKVNKNRSEHIQIRKLLDTIVLKNKQEERISILMNKVSLR